MNELKVTEVKLTFYNKPQSPVQAFCEVVLNNSLRLNDLCLKRNCDGHLLLTYPAKKSNGGQEHHFFFTITKQAEELIRNAVIEELNKSMKELEEAFNERNNQPCLSG